MASSGSFRTYGYSDSGYPDHYVFSWSVSSQSIEGNYSVITWSLRGSGGLNGNRYTNVKEKYVTVNGSTQSNSTIQSTYNGTTPFSGTTTIYHNADGTKSFSASAGGAFYSYGSYNSTGSGSWDLPTIARASTPTLSTSGVDFGGNITIYTNRASSNFTHHLYYSINGGAEVGIASDIGTEYTWTVPTSLMNNIPTTTSATIMFRLYTFSGSTNIGNKTISFTANVPSNIKPTVGTITLTPQTYSYLIQNKNTVRVSVSGCSAGNGSSISSYTFSGPSLSTTTTGTSATSGIISSNGTKTYTVTVTDARGRTASKTASITCYEYAAPTITLSAYRVASSTSTTEDDSGTYVLCNYNISYSSVASTNDVTVKLYYKKNTATSWSSTTVLTNSKNTSGNKTVGSIDIDSTYMVYATVTDNYNGADESDKITIFSAKRVLNVRANKNGMAFGKMADTDNVLDSKWPIRSDDPENTMKNLTYKGTNIISSTTDDTTSNWGDQGNLATAFYTANDLITDQPSQYGFLLNLTNGPGSPEVHQMWATQSSGSLLHRGGNSSGWNGSWKSILDSSNYTSWVSPKPISLYSSSDGSNGTITLSQSAANFTYLEVFYADNNNRQANSIKIYSPNGKYITVSCVEPATNNTEPRLYIRSSGWTISGTSITVGRSDLSGENRGVYVQLYPNANGTNVDVKLEEQNYIKIFRVLGYK